MSEMIERVARRICPKMGCIRHQAGQGLCVHDDGRNAPCRATRDQLILSQPWPAAKDAIGEIREPTEAMVERGVQVLYDEAKATDVDAATGIYAAMLDEALK